MRAAAARGGGVVVQAGLCAGLLLAVCAGRSAAWAQEESGLAALLERIARGDEDEASEATVELIERVVRPLTDALAAMEQRPPEEQRRLRTALGRLTAQVRLRLYRAGLPAADGQLFDGFAARDGELVELLFDDDPRRRLAALYQVPLEPGGAAGVLIVAKVYDWDAEVVAAALEVAGALQDEVVARGLKRYVANATAAVRSGQFGPAEQELVLALTDCTRRAIRVLGAAEARDSVPTIVAAIRCFGRPPYRRLFVVADALEALGKIHDERAVPLLLEYLGDREVHATRSVGRGTLAQLTVGDAALLALARIYDVPLEALGFYVGSGAAPMIGFTDEQTRAAALRAFAQWHENNAGRPPAERLPLTTQPALEEGGTQQP